MVYEYYETEDKGERPDVGEGWEYWSMRITPEETKAVWRREFGKYDLIPKDPEEEDWY